MLKIYIQMNIKEYRQLTMKRFSKYHNKIRFKHPDQTKANKSVIFWNENKFRSRRMQNIFEKKKLHSQ